jgi:esterase
MQAQSLNHTVPLNHTVLGESGAWILLIHGLFGSGDNLNTLAKALADRFRVVLVDLRNHGRSPHAPTMDLSEMAADIAQLQDQLGITSSVVLGHSLGGKVAMQLALSDASRVQKLIVADIAPVTYSAHHQSVFAALESVDLAALQNRQQADAQMAQQLGDAGLRQFLLKALYQFKQQEKTQYRWRFNLPVLHQCYPAILAAPTGTPFSGPTLFIKGGQSDYILPEHEAVMRKLFPVFQLSLIADAGHWLHGEKPVEFNRLVELFLAS